MPGRHHVASWQSQRGIDFGVRGELTLTPALAVFKQFPFFFFFLSLGFLSHEMEAIVIEDILEGFMR